MKAVRKRQEMPIFFFFQLQNYSRQNSGEEAMRIRGWNGKGKETQNIESAVRTYGGEKLNNSVY